MFGGMSFSEETTRPISVSLVIPYLDTYFEFVDPGDVNLILGTAFSIFISRYTEIPKKIKDNLLESSPEGIINNDLENQWNDHEDILIENCVSRIIDVELEINPQIDDVEYRIEREQHYINIINEIVTVLNDTLGSDIYGKHEIELEVIVACYDKVGEVVISFHKYDKETHRIWIVLLG